MDSGEPDFPGDVDDGAFDSVPLSDFNPNPKEEDDDDVGRAPALPRALLNDDDDDDTLERASRADSSEWHARYRQLMARTVANVLALLSDDEDAERGRWEIDVNATQAKPRFCLYRCGSSSSVVRISTMLRGRAERFAYVIKDYDPDTRMRWDNRDVIDMVQQCETYHSREGELVLVRSVHKPVVTTSFLQRQPPSVLAQCIYWHGYDEELRTHKLVFCSADHPLFGPEGGQVAARDWMVSFYLHEVAPTTPRGREDWHYARYDQYCAVIVLVSAPSSGVKVEGFQAHQMVERLELYERVVAHWDQYYGPGKDPKILANRK
jgi:hypothetical protein